MTPDQVKKIQESSKFKELIGKRRSFAIKLSIVMLLVYYGFIFSIAFAKEVLSIHFGESVMTSGLLVGVSIITLCFVMTGIYVKRANGEFDTLTNEIKEEAKANS